MWRRTAPLTGPVHGCSIFVQNSPGISQEQFVRGPRIRSDWASHIGHQASSPVRVTSPLDLTCHAYWPTWGLPHLLRTHSWDHPGALGRRHWDGRALGHSTAVHQCTQWTDPGSYVRNPRTRQGPREKKRSSISSKVRVFHDPIRRRRNDVIHDGILTMLPTQLPGDVLLRPEEMTAILKSTFSYVFFKEKIRILIEVSLNDISNCKLIIGPH